MVIFRIDIFSFTFKFLVASGISIDSILFFPSVMTMSTLGTSFPRMPHDSQNSLSSANFKALSVLVPPTEVKMKHDYYSGKGT